MRAYVALGSNLGDSRQQLLNAMDALERLPQSRIVARSHLYQTPPWGVREQPGFVNAVVVLESAFSPHALLDALLAIEVGAGRVRSDDRWGPRTLDLDLLHVDGVVSHDERLTLPHPRIAERAFVLVPLNELEPGLAVPGQGIVAELLAAVDAQGCKPIA
jgi:2-amino-4-hydroxy-6-hydroxymethyldihydropteridine diphosphokinase